MRSQKSRLWVGHLTIWLIAGLLDMIYVFYVAGYEGSGGAGGWDVGIPVAVYLGIGLFASLISWVLSVILAKPEHRDRFLLTSQYISFFLVLIIVAGLRINELYLPGITHPISILGNIGVLVGAVIICWLGKLLITRIPRIITLIILILVPVFFLCFFILFIALEFRVSRTAWRSDNCPSVVLVTIDTVRADHLGCYGYDRDTTPNLDRFAENNHLFTNCRTPMPLTSPAHATLFSARMPHEHGVFTNLSRFPDSPDIPGIAEDLTEAAYLTAGFPSAVQMGKKFNFDRGFQIFNQSTVVRGPDWLQGYYQFAPFAILTRLGIFEQTYIARDSRQVNTAFFSWIDNSERYNSNRFFAWLHYFDAHSPYQPPDDYWRMFDPDYEGEITGSQEELGAINAAYDPDNPEGSLPEGYSESDIENLRARYDGELRYLDESLGELFDGLRSRGAWDNTVVIVVADHGEGLYDDGYIGHNYSLREYEIQTACVIKGPDINLPADSGISLVDVAEYIRDVTGLTGPDAGDRGVLTAGSGEEFEPDDPPLTSMVYLQSHCWIDPPYKLVRTYGSEGRGITYSLYDYQADPDENNDLFDISDEISIALRDKLQEWLDSNQADFPELVKRESGLEGVDQATLEMLRSLGYIY